MTKPKNFLEDIVERTFRNLDIAVLAAGTALLFPQAATIATIVGGGYLVADAVNKHYGREGEPKKDEQSVLSKLQDDVNRYIDRYKLELALRLHEYGLNLEQIRDYLDHIIRREDIARYIMSQPAYERKAAA